MWNEFSLGKWTFLSTFDIREWVVGIGIYRHTYIYAAPQIEVEISVGPYSLSVIR